MAKRESSKLWRANGFYERAKGIIVHSPGWIIVVSGRPAVVVITIVIVVIIVAAIAIVPVVATIAIVTAIIVVPVISDLLLIVCCPAKTVNYNVDIIFGFHVHGSGIYQYAAPLTFAIGRFTFVNTFMV